VAAAFVKVLNKPLPAPYIEDPYETKQLLAKKELQVSQTCFELRA
jgi:hypothetical protein